MNQNKIIYVDFLNKTKIKEETIIHKEQHLDPVLQEVKNSLTPNDFAVYKKVVDDWMRRNFEKQLKENSWLPS